MDGGCKGGGASEDATVDAGGLRCRRAFQMGVAVLSVRWTCTRMPLRPATGEATPTAAKRSWMLWKMRSYLSRGQRPRQF